MTKFTSATTIGNTGAPIYDDGTNVVIGGTVPTGKLTIIGNGQTVVLDIQGLMGQLFSVTDNLIGDIFSVNDISGVPILTVNSANTVDINGTLTIDVIANETTDVDKFLVSNTGLVKYRTGAEVLSDIGALPSSIIEYGTATGQLPYWDGSKYAHSTHLVWDETNNTVNIVNPSASGNHAGSTGFLKFIGSSDVGEVYYAGIESYRSGYSNELDLRFYIPKPTTTEVARFAPTTGNLLLGTTTDIGSRLNIAGTTGIVWTANGDSYGLATIGTGGPIGGSLFINTASLYPAWQSGLGISGTYGTPARTSVINLTAYGVKSGGEGGYNSNLTFSTTASTTINEVMRLTHLQNVLIKTATDNTVDALQVNGSGHFSSNVKATDFKVFYDGINDVSDYGVYLANTLNNRAWHIQLALDNTYALWGYNGTAWGKKLGIDFAGNATLAGTLTVNGVGNSSIAGNIGISTTTPYYKLDVAGDIRVQGNSSKLFFGGTTGAGTDYLYASATGTLTTASSLQIGGYASLGNDNALYWKDSGGTLRRVGLLSGGNAMYFGAIDNDFNGNLWLKCGGDNQINFITNNIGQGYVNSVGIYATNFFSAPQLKSTVATGTAPLTVASTTVVSNLNADLLDGQHGSYYQVALTNPVTGTGTAGYAAIFTGASTVGNGIINTSGTDVTLFSTFKGANSDGYNLFIGGGGQNCIGEIGATYKGSYNTFNGFQAGYFNTTGYFNTFNGFQAGFSNTTGSHNTFNGAQAGYYNTTGYDNTFNGTYAGYSNTTGYHNTFNGMVAGFYNVDGTNNLFSGFYSGIGAENAAEKSVSDTYMTLIGYYASKQNASTLTNGTAIGYNAKVLQSNQVVLGNDNVTTTLLKGNVGIGTTTPVAAYLTTPGSTTNSSAVFGALELQSYSNANVTIAQNLYGNVSTIYRSTTAYKNGLLNLIDGALLFYNAPAGSAGATATLTQRFGVDAGGNGTFLGTLTSGDLHVTSSNNTISSTTTIKTIATTAGKSAFFDYYITDGTNSRAGTIIAIWDGTNVEYTEYSTAEIGTISGISFTVTISTGNMLLNAIITSGTWTIKTGARIL